jgi:hypothetical protein
LVIAKYASATGIRQWALLYGSSEEDRLLSVIDDGDGYVYAAGFVGLSVGNQVTLHPICPSSRSIANQ